MRSNEAMTFPNLRRKRIVPSPEQARKMEEGQLMKIQGTNLVFEKQPHVVKEERNTDLKNRVENAESVDDLKLIINDLIN